MKRGLVFLLIFFVLIINMNIVLASFSSENIGNLSNLIQKSYGPSENIKGWINISLDNEPVNSLFESNGNSISLIDLLNINDDLDFTCSPLNCETSYSIIAESEEDEKTFSLDNEEFEIFGIKFTGIIASINSIEFTIDSDAESFCYNQLEIDFFNDGIIDIRNDKVKDYPVCSELWKSYGCFNETEQLQDFDINTNYYCQRIGLTESPGFKLGVWVKNTSTGGELTMDLVDILGRNKGSCKLTMEDISDEGGEVFCDIEYLVTKSEDYYVCISSDTEGKNIYKIRGYPDYSNGCGFGGPSIPPSSTFYAYDISIEGKRFEELKDNPLEILNSLPNEDTLGGKVQNYLNQLYYNQEEAYIDCLNDCIVPIKFTSKILDKTQIITIKDLIINYDLYGGGPSTRESPFYNLSSTSSATINADFQQLYLDEGNFSVSSTIGNYTFSLTLNNEQIFSEKVFVGGIPVIKSVKPRTTASAYPTEFEVTVESDRNIIRYDWDFGNNDTKTTTTNKVIHTYNSIEKHTLTITVTDSSQSSSSKEFEIDVGSPKEIINILLAQMLTNLNNIKEQINEFSLFSQNSLKSILDLESFESELEKIQTDNASATKDEDYNLILTDLLYLEIPESVSISTSADLISFYSKEENINLEILKTIGGGDYGASDESKYIDAIVAWNQKNIETKITFEELSARYAHSEEPVLKIFELKINKKNETQDSYLIIPKFDNLIFKEDYSEEEEGEYFYIDLTDSQTTITFSTTKEIDFRNLPVFISPAINELLITEKFDKETSKMAFFILIILLLAIIGVVVYVILQGWYKKKYEEYLFKNRNELYNLISYIQSSKKKGLENKKIIFNLKKAGWKSEQITYIIRKYEGERTGMIEIPIGKFLRKVKKDKIEKISQGKPHGNFSRPKNFTPNFNPRRNKKRFS